MRSQIVEMVDLRGARTLRFEHAQGIAEKIIARFDNFEFDVCTLFFSRFRSVIAQIPTAQQIIPPVFDGNANAALGGAVYEFEPEEEDILHDLLPRNIAVQIFRALSGELAPRSTARRCRRWTTPPATPAR